MYRNIAISALLLVAFLVFSPSASADSIGGGKPDSSTSTSSVTTDDSIGGGSPDSWWDLLIGD